MHIMGISYEYAHNSNMKRNLAIWGPAWLDIVAIAGTWMHPEDQGLEFDGLDNIVIDCKNN